MISKLSQTQMKLLQPSEGGAPERQVVSDIMLFLNINGWLVHRIEQRIGFCKGTPDMIAGKTGRAVWIEAKRRAGPYRDRQGRTIHITTNVQRPGQRLFQMKWESEIPYLVARSWEDVCEKLKALVE